MENKDIIRIINEEISDFDFLGNGEQLKEEENYNLLKNEDFQKQFICDALINKKNIKVKVTDANVGGDWQEDDASKLTLEYFIDIEYHYDPNKEPARFGIDFYSQGISIEVGSNYDQGNYATYTAPSGSDYYSGINWHDIEVTLRTMDGDDIDFIALKRAPQTIQTIFIREFVESFISSETMSTDKLGKENIKSVPYC